MRKIVLMKRGSEEWYIQVEVSDPADPQGQIVVNGELQRVRVHDDDSKEARRIAEEHAYPSAPGMPAHTNGEGWKFSKVLDRFPWDDDLDAAWAIAADADFTGSPLLDHPLVKEHLAGHGIEPESLR